MARESGERRSNKLRLQYNVGKRAVSALGKVYGTKYVVGSGADTLCEAATRRNEARARVCRCADARILQIRRPAAAKIGQKRRSYVNARSPACAHLHTWRTLQGIKYVYLLELRPDEKSLRRLLLSRRSSRALRLGRLHSKRVAACADRARDVGRRSRSRRRDYAASKRQIASADAATAHKRQAKTRRATARATQRARFVDANSRKSLYRFGDGSPGSCYDIRHACKRWVQENAGLCESVPIFMREQSVFTRKYPKFLAFVRHGF